MTSGLIGVGLIGIVISAFSITMNSFQTSSRALAQKMEISQLQSNIKGRLADGSLCGCNLSAAQHATSGTATTGGQSGITYTDAPDDDEVGPQTTQSILVFNPQTLTDLSIPMQTLFGRCANNAPSNPILRAGAPVDNTLTGLAIDRVNVENFRQLNGSLYAADIVVRFDSARMIVGRKPMAIQLSLQTSTAPGGMLTVNSCSTQDRPQNVVGPAAIPPTLAGDPGTQCRYGAANGPVGVTLYRGAGANNGVQPANPTPYRLCCLTGTNTGFGQSYGANDINLVCAAYL